LGSLEGVSVGWVPLDTLFEAPRERRTAYQSGRRELFGVETRRNIIGFEKPGERKMVSKRKRPEKFQSVLNRTNLRAKTTKSRVW